MLPEKINDNLWLLAVDSGVGYTAVVGHLLPAAAGNQFIVYSMKATKESTYLEITQEIWSTFFWAAIPGSLADDIVAAFASVEDNRAPIELVYSFGGVLGDRVPTIWLPKEVVQ